MPEASRPVTEFNSVTTARAAGKLKDVSFSVASGELVGVLATPPEALREFALLAAGLTSPLSGTVIALGKKAVQLDKNDRCRIGYLPKGSGLLRAQRLGEQVVSTARTAGLTAQEAFDAAKNIIGDLAITQHAHKYPQAVSSAERKLFALACALCVKRELLIIHSPLEDVSGQAATLLLRKLVTFARDGAGVLVLTEQPEVVEGICDRVLFISAGEVVAEDTPQNLCATCETDEVLLVPRGMPNTAQLGVGQHKFIKSVRHTERGFELELEGGQANLAILLKTLEERGIELEAMTFVRSRLAAAFEKAAGGRT